MERYSIITEKNPREIVLLRGSGCTWRRCRFCDYHLDFSNNQEANYQLNQSVLAQVTGIHGHLEVINSGSFTEIDEKTMNLIQEICKTMQIKTIHFESHWKQRDAIKGLRAAFAELGTRVKMKIGVETFDETYREEVMAKGMAGAAPAQIAQYFDECCLLFGLSGQSLQSMEADIETGLEHFDRVCINIMVENTAKLRPDQAVINLFMDALYPKYKKNPRVDILIKNTDFGVGGENHE